MKIKWYGTASLLLESGETRLAIDPYLKEYNKKLPPVDVQEVRDSDAIFITHPHFDHFKDIAVFTKNGGARTVYASENAIEQAYKNAIQTDCMVPMSANNSYTIGNFTVKTYHSRHCRFDARTVLGVVFSPRTYFKHAFRGVKLVKDFLAFRMRGDIYALEIFDEQSRVMVLGSAGYDPKECYPKGCDLLVFPYQGRADLHKQLEKFLQIFEPKGVLFDHFDDAFPPFTHTMNVKKGINVVKKHLPEGCVIVPQEGEWYEISRSQ
ncbi:MAG: MBL fold metallo-hydrolase [Clostridia bacterium]|nr:MBL fold metallo-hydrolase [Clostridia bacterium]